MSEPTHLSPERASSLAQALGPPPTGSETGSSPSASALGPSPSASVPGVSSPASAPETSPSASAPGHPLTGSATGSSPPASAPETSSASAPETSPSASAPRHPLTGSATGSSPPASAPETSSTSAPGVSSPASAPEASPSASASGHPLTGSTTESSPPVREAEYIVVDFDRVTNEDIIVALMGPTGAGKSSFIASITNDNGEGVGHDLTSFTSEIKATKLEFGGSSVVLVDTPGFNDTKKSDLDILNLISDWLNPRCPIQSQDQSQSQISPPFLSAILYFHRITDNRMAGTPLKNLRVFEKLCGENAMSKVILVTTMWDEVEIDVGTERLKELKDSYWKGMISQGSATFECAGPQGSPINLLQKIVQQKKKQKSTGEAGGNATSPNSRPVPTKLLGHLMWWKREKALKREEAANVLLQEEISNMNMGLKETAAGRQLCSRLEELAQKRMETLRKIREETKKADEKTAEDLWKEFNEVKNQLDSTLTQARQLKVNPQQHVMRLLRNVGLARRNG